MRILFQGDSITDAGRDRRDPRHLGYGYPKYAAELIKQKYPDIYFEFYNLGISGNKTDDLAARWQSDCIDINPDIVSILIGINDTWHFTANNKKMPNEYYEKNYRHILQEIKTKTNAKIIILEQFLVYNPLMTFMRPDMAEKMEITRKLAREFADEYIPLDGLFAKESVKTSPTLLAEDGVHPSELGAQFIAKHYLEAISPLIEEIRK